MPKCFPKTLRIRKRKTFTAIARSHQRLKGTNCVMHIQQSQSPRLGINVSRKFGPAVWRNRFKRLAREAFRLTASTLPPIDVVVMPYQGVRAFSLKGMLADLNQLKGLYAQSAAETSCCDNRKGVSSST